MYAREQLLDKIAQHEALVMHGTLDITVEQWAVIYDRVEWQYRSTATEQLSEAVHDDDAVDSYDDEVEVHARDIDALTAGERGRAVHLQMFEDSGEVSFA